MKFSKEQEELLSYFWRDLVNKNNFNFSNKEKDGYIILSKQKQKREGKTRTYIRIFHEDCGSIFEVRQDDWNSYRECSCVTKSKSIGEEKISSTLKNLLKYNHNYSFEEQFKICKNPKTNSWLRMDFAIKDKFNNVILFLEYDGYQHYEQVSYFHKTVKDFKESQLRDKIKEEYAKNHFQAPVIRFIEPRQKSKKTELIDNIPKEINKILNQYLK